MTEKEKPKRKRTPDPWWQFPQSFAYKGASSLETLIPHLQGYHRYEWDSGDVSVEIEEIEANQEYRFALTYDKVVSSGQYRTTLSGHISQPIPRIFIIEGTSVVEPSGLTNLVAYMLLVICISLPVALKVPIPLDGLRLMLVLSAPMLIPLFSHLWRRHILLERINQILHQYEIYGPNVVLEPEQIIEHGSIEEAESLFVFEDGILKEEKRA